MTLNIADREWGAIKWKETEDTIKLNKEIKVSVNSDSYSECTHKHNQCEWILFD